MMEWGESTDLTLAIKCVTICCSSSKTLMILYVFQSISFLLVWFSNEPTM